MRRPSRMFAVAAAVVLTGGGCAMFASANAAHSQISPCVDNPAWSVADFLIASGLGALLVATETGLDQPLWFAIPGVYVISGTLGTIGVYRCIRDKRGTPASAYEVGPYVMPTPASPPPADVAGEPAEPIAPAAPAGPQLRLPSDYNVGSRDDAGVSDAVPATCGAHGSDTCPPKHTCVLDDRNRGHCVPQ